MDMITFTTQIKKVGSALIVQLPLKSSKELPSRGQVAVDATINDEMIHFVVEPDGRFGHWFKLKPALQKKLHLNDRSSVKVTLAPTKTWPEPKIPADFAEALDEAPVSVKKLWKDITPMARWEWIRWVDSTNVVATRDRRVEVSMSKMQSGKRRPCCFNLASCTDPTLTKSGKLVETV